MTRGQVAERAGVGRETVRYYEQRGLIPEPPRSEGDYRVYTEADVGRIRFVKRAQELGFTLKEIRGLLALRLEAAGDCSDVRRHALAKLTDVEEKMRDLERIRTVLLRLAEACHGKGPASECPILEAIDEAGALT